jgi:hypothetical protein
MVGDDYLVTHRAHDVAGLLARWERVAAVLGWDRCELQAGVPAYRSRVPWREDRALYLSAGIHGDEPAGTEGLIVWAERSVGWLREQPCCVVPCFNPHGLRENTRGDEQGTDLNRQFHGEGHPLIGAWKAWLGSRRFRLALCLHEDYDATGTYVYELGEAERPIGGICLDAAAGWIPRERRAEIDGREMSGGHLFRSGDIADLLEEMEAGLPEAIYLRSKHAPLVLTFETPSEFALDRRVAAQVRCIEAAVANSGLA